MRPWGVHTYVRESECALKSLTFTAMSCADCHRAVKFKKEKKSRNQLVGAAAAKRRPKPTATGETWQSCRLGKERVLSRLLLTMPFAALQTDAAELVRTVVGGRRSVHAVRRGEGRGKKKGRLGRRRRRKKPLVLPKAESEPLDDPSAWFPGASPSPVWVQILSRGEALAAGAARPSRTN